MSGHIFFKHEWYGFDDALYAAVRLIRAVSPSGKSLTELKGEMPISVATPELRFQVDETRKFAVVDEVADRLAAEGAEVDTTDGVRVKTADGWWLLRASNTQDVLVARAEATGPSRARPIDGNDQRSTGSQRNRSGRSGALASLPPTADVDLVRVGRSSRVVRSVLFASRNRAIRDRTPASRSCQAAGLASCRP